MAGAPPGDVEERLQTLLREFGALLRAAVARVCRPGSGVSPDDVEQEARIRLWRALESEREIRRPASYIARVATSAAIDALRRVRARREEPLMSGRNADESGGIDQRETLRAPGPSPEALAAGGEVTRKLESALANLQEDRARAVRLHLLGFGSGEIARLLGWSEPRARNLLPRSEGSARAAGTGRDSL